MAKHTSGFTQGSHGHEIPGKVLKSEKYFSSTGKVLEFIKGLGKVLELIKGPGKSWKNTLSTACGEGNVTVEIPPKPDKKRIFMHTLCSCMRNTGAHRAISVELASTMPGKCPFNNLWLTNEKYWPNLAWNYTIIQFRLLFFCLLIIALNDLYRSGNWFRFKVQGFLLSHTTSK